MKEKILRLDIANLERVVVVGVISILMLSIFPIMSLIQKQIFTKADQAMAKSVYTVAMAQSVLANSGLDDYKLIKEPSGCKDLSLTLLGEKFYQNPLCEESKILFNSNGDIIGATWNQKEFKLE